MKIPLLVIYIYCLPTAFCLAQDSLQNTKPSIPIPVEVMGGNNRLYFQMVVNKRIAGMKGLGFFSVSSFQVDYLNDKTKNDYITPVLLNYEIWKGFGLVSGVAVNSNWGFRPYSGLQYIKGFKDLMVIVVPGFYLTETHNFETLTLIEYKPRLKDAWSLYSRVQGLYNQNMETNHHDRSYLSARLGVSYHHFAFGLGANWDYYGPTKVFRENYGAFLRVSFQ